MGLWDTIDRIAGGGARAPMVEATTADAATEIVKQLTGNSFDFRNLRQTPTRTTENILADYSKVPRLRSPVHRIAHAVAATPWKVGRVAPGVSSGQRAKRVKSFRRDLRRLSGIGRQLHLQKLISGVGEIEELEGHPALDLLERGNPALTGFQVRQVVQLNLDLVGEILLVLEDFRGGRGRPRPIAEAELWPFPVSWVDGTSTEERVVIRRPRSTETQSFDRDQIIRLKDVDPADPYGAGSGFGRSLANEIDADEYAARTAAKAFFNDAIPPLLVMLEGASTEALETFKTDWINRNLGADKRGVPHFVNTKIDAKDLAKSLVDMQLQELRKFEAATMRETLGVPPEIVGVIENSNRATIDAADYLFARYVVEPRLAFLEDQMNERLMRRFGDAEGIVLYYDSPVPEDAEFTKAIMQQFPHWFSGDEIRGTAGFGPLEGDAGELHSVGFSTTFARPEEFEDISASGGPDPFASDLPGDDPGAGDEDEDEDDEEAAFVDYPSKAIGDLPSGIPQIERLVALVSEGLFDDALRLLRGGAGLNAWIRQIEEDFGIQVPDELREFISNEIANRADRSKRQIAATTRNRLRARLKAAWDRAKRDSDVTVPSSIAAENTRKLLSEAIDTVMVEQGETRARIIADTETHAAANVASVKTIETNFPAIRWVSQRDGRVRDTHRGLDGSVVEAGAPFTSPSGATGKFPGGFGEPSEDVNCRCFIVPAKVGDTAERRAFIWKRYQQLRAPWRRRVAAETIRAFRKARKTLLADLDGAFDLKAAPEGARKAAVGDGDVVLQIVPE